MTATVYQQLEEKELFRKIAEGDELAFAEIFFRYTAKLQPFLLKVTRSEQDTEEIIQDVFLRLWLSRKKLTEVDNHQAYIFTISNNRLFTFLQKKARRMQVEHQSATPDITHITEEMIDLHENTRLINEAVEQLPPQKKLIFELSRNKGWSHEQIAHELHLSKNTVKNHMTEALRMIREYLRRSPDSSLPLIILIIKVFK